MAPHRLELRLGPGPSALQAGVDCTPPRILVPRSALPPVQIGDSVTATVMTNIDSLPSSCDQRLRLQFAGKTIEVALAMQLRAGDVIEFEVTSVGAMVELKVRQPNIEPTLRMRQDAVIQAIIKQLNLTEDTVGLLKDILRSPALQYQQQLAPQGELLSPIQFESKDFESPEVLARKLISFNPSEGLRRLAQLETERQRGAALATAAIEARVNTLAAQLELAATSRADFQKEEHSGVERLMSLLRVVGTKAQEVITYSEKRLFEFIRSHVDALAGKEKHLQEVMRAAHSDHAVVSLLRYVQNISNTAASSGSLAQRQFIDFIRSFEGQLRTAVEQRAPDATVRLILEKALSTIRDVFKLTPHTLPDISPRLNSVSPESENPLPAGLQAVSYNELPVDNQRALRVIDAQIRAILASPEPLRIGDGAAAKPSPVLINLVETLSDLAARPAASHQLFELNVKHFASDLRDRLNQALEKGFSDTRIREILHRSLRELGAWTELQLSHGMPRHEASLEAVQQFIEEALVSLSASKNPGLQEACSQITPLLKSLSVQLEALIKGESSPETVKNIVELQQSLDGVEFLSRDQSAQSLQLHQAIRTVQREVGKLVEILYTATANDAAQKELLISAGSQQASELNRLILEVLTQVGNTGRASIESGVHRVFRALVASHDKTANPGAVFPEGLLSDAAFRSALELLMENFRADLSRLSGQEKDFLSFVEDLIQRTPLSTEAVESPSKKAVQRALASILQHYEKRTSRETDTASDQHAAIRQVENLLKGQEFLQTINPLMQTAGEPALLLFPLFFQGMSTKLEVALFHQPTKINEDESAARKEPEPAGEHISMQFTLPHLGELFVQVSHREGKVRIAIQGSSQKVCAHLEKLSSVLDSQLHRLGYTLQELAAACELPRHERPAWCHDLIKAGLAVA